MVNKEQQIRVTKKVERLFEDARCEPVSLIEKDLVSLGFTEKGADPVAVAFDNAKLGLYLEIELDERRCIHSYILISHEEKDKRQKKFRW
jgi:hypothetical protein